MNFVCDTCGQTFETYLDANGHQQDFPTHKVMWEQEITRKTEIVEDEEP